MRPFVLPALLACAAPLFAQAPSPLPPPNGAATIVLDHGAPAAPVTALAFSPDGTELYTGGFDKVVRRYRLANGQFVLVATIPIPIGPGNAGAINALAVSPDGKWVAVGGRAPFREESTFGETATVVVNTAGLSLEAKQDHGVVYLIDTTNPLGGRVLRGQRGEVRALAFAQPNPATGPVLVTAGLEWVANDKQVGAVHVFNAATGAELDSRADLPATETPPGLAAWPVADRVRVAIAWEQLNGNEPAPGELLLWDAPKGPTQRLADGHLNSFVAVRTGGNGTVTEIISGGFQNLGVKGKPQFGQLMLRPADAPTNGKPISFQAPKQYFLPLSVATVGNATAVLLQIDPPPANTAGRAVELRLLAPNAAEPVRVPLSGVSDRMMPVLAASPNGRFFAVSGFANNRIELFDGSGKRVQVIAGVGGGFTGVKFVAGNRLWVGGDGETLERGGQVFEFAARRAIDNPGNLVVEEPKGAVVFEKHDVEKAQLTLKVDGQSRTFQLRDGDEPSPRGFAIGPMVVAIAHTNLKNFLTSVTIFDRTSGRRVRQLVGPVQDIQSLAISGNGQLLAGVAKDRTVFVWTLKDIEHAQGAIDGLIVMESDKRIVVVTVEANSPAAGKLAPGDVIEAVGGNEGELKALSTGHAFRDEVGVRAVGSTVRVRRVRGKAPAEIVALPVGRSLVQRDPLFMLWIDAEANPAGRNWIGWHPTGLYDANSPASEARIGWQSSTGDPAQPAVVVGIGQFRKLFYKRTLLEHLVANAERVELPPPQDARLVLRVAPLDPMDNLRMVRTRDATLHASIDDPDGTLWLQNAFLRWQVIGPDGQPGPWREVALAGKSSVEIPLKDVPWERGLHHFNVEVRLAPEGEPVLKESISRVLYLPPAPELIVTVDGKPLAHNDELPTTNKSVRIVVALKPGTGSGAVSVELKTTAKGFDKPVMFTPKEKGEYEPRVFELDPNEKTVFLFKARNSGAEKFPEYEQYEISDPKMYVRFVQKPSVRLRIASVARPPRGGDGPHVVEVPEVALEAKIVSQSEIKTVEWNDGDGQWVKQAAVGKEATNTRTATVPADGMARTLQVRVTDANGQQTVESLDVANAPLPRVGFSPIPDAVTSSELPLQVRVDEVPAALRTEVKLIVASGEYGQSREIAVVFDPAAKAWNLTEGVTLYPGKNTFSIVVQNKFHRRFDPNLAEVEYRRPPLVLEVQPLNAGASAVGDVSAIVAAPRGLQPRAFSVNGSPVDARPPQRIASFFGIELWQVRIAGVPVRIGDAWLNQVHLAVRNGDGERVAVAVPVLREQHKAAPPPVILLTQGSSSIQHGQSIATNQPRFNFGVRIASNAALVRAALWHQAGPQSPLVQLPTLDPRNALAVPDGFDLSAPVLIELREGVNLIRIVAANAGNGATIEFSVTYTPPPVRIEIEGIDEVPPNAAPAVPLGAPSAGKQLIADTAFVRVRGKVVWTQANPVLEQARDLSIVLTANQVVHFPVDLQQPMAGQRERAFTAPLFLNSGSTRVILEVRSRAQLSIPQSGIGPAEIELTCRAPLTQQRLHIVVIAPDATAGAEEVKLVRSVLSAVGGEAPTGATLFRAGEFTHRAFSRAVLYSPLVQNVTRSDIMGKLAEVEGVIRQSMSQQKNEWINDVVLVYYQGRDRVGSRGTRLLATSLTQGDKMSERTMISVDELERTPGLRLIVLNVANPGQPSVPADAIAADPLQLRYPWKDAAASAELLPLFGNAVAQEPTLGGILDRVRDGARKNGNLAGDPSDAIPLEIKPRRLGLGKPE